MTRDRSLLGLAAILALLVAGLVLLAVGVPGHKETAQVAIMIAGMLIVAAFSALSRFMESPRAFPVVQISFDEMRTRKILDRVIGSEYRDVRDRKFKGNRWDLESELLVYQDPTLALAKLRIDMERELRHVATRFDFSVDPRKSSLKRLVDAGTTLELFGPEIGDAINQVVSVCNGALHGGVVTSEVAANVLNIGEDLIRILQSEHLRSHHEKPSE